MVFFGSLFVNFRQKKLLLSRKNTFLEVKESLTSPLIYDRVLKIPIFYSFPYSLAFLNQESVVFLLKSFSSNSSVDLLNCSNLTLSY